MSPFGGPAVPDKSSRYLRDGFISIGFCAKSITSDLVLRPASHAAVCALQSGQWHTMRAPGQMGSDRRKGFPLCFLHTRLGLTCGVV